MSGPVSGVEPGAAGVRRRQRLSAYGLLTRGPAARPTELLLTRLSGRGHQPGAWTLPGGGVEHGEDPRHAVVREIAEEAGLAVQVGRLLDVCSTHFTGRAPDGGTEDFHGVQLLFAVIGTDPTAVPAVAQTCGTTDAVAWTPLLRLRAGQVEVLDVVRFALGLLTR